MREPSSSDEPIFLLANGRYAVLEPLGEGGTATVHRCVDRDLGVERAIKLRRVREQDLDTSMAQRLADEARVMARLDHPHILPVYDVGMDQGWQYVVMELAADSLSERTKEEGAFSPQQGVDMVLDLLGALELAHEAGVVHRDIKPHNVLIGIGDGRVLLADWGIARLDDRDQTLTRTGMAMGSVSYMAPEQRLDAHDVGPPADVYATGAMLYNLITCASPVDLFTAQETSPRWDGVPAELVTVLRRACAYDAQARFASASELAAALREIRDRLPDQPLVGASEAVHEPHGTLAMTATLEVGAVAPRRTSRWTTGLGLGLLGLSAGTLIAGIGWWVLQAPTVADPAAPAPVATAPALDPGRTIRDAPPDDPPPADDPGTSVAADPSPPPRVSGAVQDPGPSAPEPEPPTEPPTEPSTVAVLPIHGPWRAFVEGSAARLVLDGPTDALRGTLTTSPSERVSVTGRFAAPRLTLEVGGEGPARGTWSCELAGDRLRGTITRAATGDVVPVSLVRVDDE